ncbi:MAG: hypothetical protein B7Y41_01650 [Hydrogenophilales bacterium 28-61-23]|nr:MAG: hypothetical protein B7Y41_01650 [Hydrogenophilales bacterium 28-61-23]
MTKSRPGNNPPGSNPPGGNPISPPYLAWLEADAAAGPTRSYRLACRLPELMRAQGRTASARAGWALARTVFCKGRFEESRALLASIDMAAIDLEAITPDADSESRLEWLIPAQQSWALAMLGEVDRALAQAELARSWAETRPEPGLVSGHLAQLHCFLDAPEATLAWSRRARASARQSVTSNIARLLEYWALSRLAQTPDETAAQTALAELRRHSPAHEARAFSLYAQALFHQAPALAVTQLDAALDLNARFGLHHWTARLLHLKSKSLDAGGQLSEASRFLELAREVAQRQDARLFLAEIEGIESRPRSSPTLLPAS